MLKVLVALAVVSAAAAGKERCDELSDKESCAQLERCPENEEESCVWNDKTEACQCGKSCTMLSEKECGDKCPENADEQCKWDGEEKMCFCPEKTCKDFSKDKCESNACPQDEEKKCLWNGEKEECVCLDKCAVLPEKYCPEYNCPDDSSLKCAWTDAGCDCRKPPPTPAPVTRCEQITSQRLCLSTICPDSSIFSSLLMCVWSVVPGSGKLPTVGKCHCDPNTRAPATKSPPTYAPATRPPPTPAPITKCEQITSQKVCLSTICPDSSIFAPKLKCVWTTVPGSGKLPAIGKCHCDPNTRAPATKPPPTPAPITRCEDISSQKLCLLSFCPLLSTVTKKLECVWSVSASGLGRCHCDPNTPVPKTRAPPTPAPPSKTCADIAKKEECVSTLCQNSKEQKCSWDDSTKEGKCFCEETKCEDIEKKDQCVETSCPNSDDQKCTWDDSTKEGKCVCEETETCKMYSQEKCMDNACPQDEKKKCLWDSSNEECVCADKCSSIPKDYCEEFYCPEDESEESKCKYTDEACVCVS